jgi:hypothetical protein
MADVVVFPEQLSFDVRVQRNSPRRRLTIKNLGIMAAKLTVSMPESDAFVVTDSKGKTLTSTTNVTMNPDTSHCLFVQKRSTVGIVPEDVIVVSGGKKTYRVALKPAVSLVSLEELEAVADRQPSDDSAAASFSRGDFPEEPHQTRRPPAEAADLPRGDVPEEPHQNRRSRIPTSEPAKRIRKAASEPSRPPIDEPDPEPAEGPARVELEAPRKLGSVPVGRPGSRQELGADADVLERSLHVRFSFRDGDERARPRAVSWYAPDAFTDLQEPEFTFELMVTGDQEDPVFCVDGDYYDPSGRLLSVQQGKGKVIYVTENGYDPMADFDD